MGVSRSFPGQIGFIKLWQMMDKQGFNANKEIECVPSAREAVSKEGEGGEEKAKGRKKCFFL